MFFPPLAAKLVFCISKVSGSGSSHQSDYSSLICPPCFRWLTPMPLAPWMTIPSHHSIQTQFQKKNTWRMSIVFVLYCPLLWIFCGFVNEDLPSQVASNMRKCGSTIKFWLPCVLKWGYPQLIHFNRISIENHPFGGTPIVPPFMETPHIRHRHPCESRPRSVPGAVGAG